MRSIAFLSQKGGSRKTTLAIHVAVAAQTAGEQDILLDTDPQASASAWAQAHKADSPTIQKAVAANIPKLFNTPEASLAVIDTAPRTTPGIDIIAHAVGFLVIPCRPSVLDLAAITSSVQLAKASGRPAAFVLNACDARAPEIAQARKVLERYLLAVSPVEIGHRRSFSRALARVSLFQNLNQAEKQPKKSTRYGSGLTNR